MRASTALFALAMPAVLALLLPSPAAADLGQVEQKIVEYAPQAAREALKGAGGSETERLVAEGRILGLEKKWKEAEERLKLAAQKQPADPAPWVYLGEARQRAANEAGAREAFQKAAELARKRLEAGSADALTHYYLGRALQGLKDWKGAEEHLGHARDGGAPLATYQFGVTRALQERWQEAYDLLSKALEQSSGNAYAYYYRGLAASKLGRKDQLINDLGRFVAIAPDAPEAERARRIIQSASR